MTSRPPTDLRKQRAQLYRRLTVLVVVVLVIGGGSLIALVYGAPAGALGVLCLLGGAGVIALIWLVFTLIGKWVNPDE
jgi:polyferredoxin